MLEPRQGGDICSLAGLTWPHVIIPATMSSLQYRHGAPPRHGAMCRGPPSGGFYPVGGFLSEPCQYIPCPLLPTTWSCVFIARHNINWVQKHFRTFQKWAPGNRRNFVARGGVYHSIHVISTVTGSFWSYKPSV